MTSIASFCNISNHWLSFLHCFKDGSSFLKCQKSMIPSLSTSTNIVKAIDKAMLWFGDVLVSPREIGDGYIQDFEWSMNLSLFGSRKSLARIFLSASNTLISPLCTTYNIQFKESQQMNVFTRLTFTSPLQAFLSQWRYNYLHRGFTPMKSTSSTISRSLIEVHTSNEACKLSISTSNQACKSIFTSNQACKNFKFPFQI